MKIKIIITCITLFFVVSTSGFGEGFSIKPIIFLNNSYLTDNLDPGCLENSKPVLRLDSFFQLKTTTQENRYVSLDSDLISLFQQLNEKIYLRYLENITSFGPRVTGTQECEDAGEYIYNEFSSMGLDVRFQYWEFDDELFGTNVEATYYGKNQESDEIYITCAHYDSVSGSPGADDDGSGVAFILAAAYLMRNAEFDHILKFVAFSGEEQGLVGSYFYVEEALQNQDNIVAVLNVDMIGFAETQEDESQVKIYDDEGPSIWITNFTEDIAEQYFDIFGLEIIRSGYSYGSDHYYFWEAGYNAVFYAEKNFNDYWHQPEDTIENMNIEYAVRVSKLIIATLSELSGFITLNAPYIPNKPLGEVNGIVGIEYTYSTSTTDPQDEQISYLFDWGDGTDSGWIGPLSSGIPAEANHTWTKRNTYNLKVKAKDINGYESDWSEPLTVTIPRNRFSTNRIISEIYEKINMFLAIINKLFS